MKAAEQLRLPQLAATINIERVRLRMPITPAVSARSRTPRTIPRGVDGIATMTAQLDEAPGIRLLFASDSTGDREQAFWRAADLLAGIDVTSRPLAALHAQLLFVESLTAGGRAADARTEHGPVSAVSAEHGLPRLLVDAGPG